MDSELLKGLAQEIGSHVDSKVNEVEERIDELAADVAAIPTIEGPHGPQGEQGEKGADGIDGADGKDGVDGIDGKDGVDGADGKDGVDGKDGDTVIGPEGPAGKDGVDGIDGKDGVDGADGKDGSDGVDGEKGEDGLGVDTPVWSDQVYREGSVVQHHYGQYFRALTDTAADPDSDDWERVGNHGFRLTGPFAKDKTYRDGDLYVKDFGLFLWRGEDAMCIAGRGPRGERGKAGRDGVGKDGKDGRDGKDGSQIKALEFEGSTLVAVFQDADGETKEHCVSLDPFLQTAAIVTKEAHAQNNKQLIEEAELQVKQLWEQLNNHLDDQDAIPIRFYRGLWKADESYQVGDWIRYGSEGLVCRRANTGITPHNFPTSKVNAADYWQSLTGQMTHGVNSGGDDSGGGGVTASDVLVKEGGLGGTKFSQFPTVVADAQKQLSVVGLQEGRNVKAVLTTDLVSTNPDVTFRDARGKFRSTKDLEDLTDQLKVNRFIANELDALNEAIENIDFPEGADLSGFATKAHVDEVDRTSQMRDDALKAEMDEWDVANTAVHVKLEQQIIREASYSDDQDAKLQEQIDELAAGDVDLSPVEDRLDDIEAVLPKTPAVIDPVPVGEQTLKITGSRPSGAGGEAGSVLMWKAEAGSGGSPYNECKFVVPDTSVVDPDAAVIWWKQGDKTQRWDMSGAGWFTNSNVLHYSATETVGDTLVDGQPVELFYTDPNATGDDLIDTISRVESKADDRKLQAEIEELSLIVADAINAVQRDHGAWIYAGDGNSIPRNSGEFTLFTNDLTQNDNVVTLNTTDADGKMHGFNADIEAGEYLEIVDETDPADYALYVLVEAPSVNGTLAEFKVALKKASRNGFDLGDRCQVRIIHLDESNINLEELDDRYLKLSGGTMTGILELPRFNVKKLDGEAICLIEGMTEGNATSARLTFSNKTNAGAYGNLTWNGNSDQGWFQFNKDVDFSNKNLQSINNIRLSGNKTIQESTNTRIKFENKVVITKPGANGANRGGFVLKGGVDGNSDGNLLSVYHNASGLDSVDYYGKQEGENNIATVGYVDSKVGGGGSSPVSAKLQSGFQLWSGSRLAEGCFNLLDANGTTTSNCKVATGLTFHTYQGFDDWPWMKYALRSGGQIHLTDVNGKYLMSKPVLRAEKHDATSGDDPVGAIWHFEFSIYGMEAETSLSGLYFVEFENCMEAG